ncbi:hypothetical protein RUM44_004535 [Polyplax serrata]|uniref:Uncharacterized protein n=1 Tax=Polyplax serrata TaxID=468196 RepID=A0ABR1B3J1_POLSC
MLIRNSGEKGYLEGLASRYADLFNTHYGDVLEHLEELRKKEWNELSPRICVIQSGRESPGTPPGTYSPTHQVTAVSLHNLTTSLSQPIYVPGKYSPSSCLSDKEEDEIYGFAGYGVYGKQMLQRQQQRKLLAQNQPAHAQGYQTCLSPRSAYFYEFPPTDQTNTQTTKKKTTFSKFLRGLKTVHRKEKHGSSSRRHDRDPRFHGGNSSQRKGKLTVGGAFHPDKKENRAERNSNKRVENRERSRGPRFG